MINEWWSAKLTCSEAPLSAEILLREMQKTQNCALCGLSLGLEPSCIHVATGRPIHADCLGVENVEEP